MPSDRSRGPDRTRFGYTGVAAQQGRVILDRDFNAQQSLTADRIAADALDFVGPSGTPDDGFRISLIDQSSPPPRYWQPPVTVASSPPETPGESGDFLIAPGTMYVGGQRVYFPPQQGGSAITYSYLDQPDWPVPPPPGSPPPGIELVYLSLLEQEVSAVEDPDLLEVALGGPDTTQRLKLRRRVHRLSVASADCAGAWQTAVAAWAERGLMFDPATMRLLPSVGLQVGFSNPVSETDPCDPVATGGYLGNDNQLIRIRIDRSTGQPRVLWGYDDASFIYRVASVGNDSATLTLAADPPDAFHYPQQDQWVEVLTTASVLAQEPDENDPTGQTQILRVAAEPEGVLCQVQQPYGPLPGGVQNVLVVTPPLPGNVSNSPLPLFVRVWQAAQPIQANGEVTLAAPSTDVSTGTTSTVSTGVTATFSPPTGADVADGLFWEIAVRPATPQGVYPEDLLLAPQPPDGPRRWVCPLAVIDWTNADGPTVTDCRNTFDNLVVLSRRRPGCCTVSIRPGDVTAAMPLQVLIDRAVNMAALAAGTAHAPLTVCLEAGTYLLPATLYLQQRHTNLTLEACGGPAILRAQQLADLKPFTDGLIVVDGARHVTLSGLGLYPPVVQMNEATFSGVLTLLSNDNIAVPRVLRAPYTSFGVRAMNAPHLTLDRCTVQLQPTDPGTTRDQLVILADFFGAAVFLQGNCVGTRITCCEASSGFTPSYTPVVVDPSVASPAALRTFDRILALHLPPPSTGSPASTSPPSASPPVGSPPATEARVLDLQVGNALDLVAAKRLAADPTTLRFTVSTAGVLAAGSPDTYCELGQSTISGSTFDGFAFGTYISALMSILRVRDNTISGGVAGLWLEMPGFADPSGLAEGTDRYYATMLFFEEYQILFALASVFPAPKPPAPSHRLPVVSRTAPRAAINELRQLPPYSLLLTNNQIDVQQPTQSVGASAALRLALYRDPIVQTLTSVIISSNRLYGGMAGTPPRDNVRAQPATPAALITMMRGTPCAITGNVVINGGIGTTSDDPAVGTDDPSLWLVVSGSANETTQLAVTGNVLQGRSDLADVRRLGVKTFETWSPFNADPA